MCSAAAQPKKSATGADGDAVEVSKPAVKLPKTVLKKTAVVEADVAAVAAPQAPTAEEVASAARWRRERR